MSELKRNTRTNERISERTTERLGKTGRKEWESCVYTDCQEKDITSFCGHDSEGQKPTNENARSITYSKKPS